MNLKTIKSLAVTSAVMVGVAAFGTTALHAATPATTDATARLNPMTSFITALSQKFNLNQADVQKVFDELETQKRTEMAAQHAAELKTRLAQAVTAGTLTQAQSDLITAKHAEMKSFMEKVKNMTETERQTALKAKHEELKTWATANAIPAQFARFSGKGGPGGEHGRRGPGGFGGEHNKRGGMRGQRPGAQGTRTAPVATPQSN